MISLHTIKEVYKQIIETNTCVCGAKILPSRIEIIDFYKDGIHYEIDCHRCNNTMELTCEYTMISTDNKSNASTKILHDIWVDEPITEMDCEELKNALNEFNGSFIDTFNQ